MRNIGGTSTRTISTDFVDLAHRAANGFAVTLLWERETNEIILIVDDSCAGSVLQFAVDGGSALDAFYHPFAYAPVLQDESSH